MNQENLKFLQDRLFYLGTEKRLFPELEKNIAEGKPDFTLPFSNHYDKDKLSATLHFRKSDTTDMYFVNRYDASLQKPGQEGKSQTFYLDNGKGVTMKEAYNLLDGRSVNKELKNKEGVAYNAWVKLDFNNRDEKGNAKMLQYHKNYGYNLHVELLKLPITHLPSEQYTQLAASLEKGNVHQIKFPDNNSGLPSSVYVSANPQFKTLDMSDEHGRPLSREEVKNLHAMGELAKESQARGLSVEGPKTQNTPELRSENTTQVKEAKATANLVSDKKSGLKRPDKSEPKEKIKSLMPKRPASQKKGLSI